MHMRLHLLKLKFSEYTIIKRKMQLALKKKLVILMNKKFVFLEHSISYKIYLSIVVIVGPTVC